MPYPENLLRYSFTIKEKIKRGRRPSLSFLTFFIFLFWDAPKSLHMATAAMKLKDAYSLEEKL